MFRIKGFRANSTKLCANIPDVLLNKIFISGSCNITGLSAERWLIDGAELIQYLPPRVIIYRRPGGLDAAVHDFYALKPTKVEKWNLIDGVSIRVQNNVTR